jgi:D-tyrosyl-tRNA(Tyr) deacylase
LDGCSGKAAAPSRRRRKRRLGADSRGRDLRAVLQRVSRARVRVGGETVGQIGNGLVILLGVGRHDDALTAERLATKIVQLRIFENESGKFDRGLLDVGADALVVSQFTLLADTSKGNRPSFTDAAPPEQAEPLYDAFCGTLRQLGVSVETGVFGARMEVELVNDGPVTVILHLQVSERSGEPG